ncbi:hypothetical protein [Ferruginibacter sp. SUN106]|uniref:hypothetical protein n=1 Tax=Ferruginibacter sp. SUN106 TaxID=2978348 RepID=UPI003D36B5CF
MARQKGLIKLSGTDKRSGTVFVESKYGVHTRAQPKAGARKNDPVLKKQYSRNSSLNLLAADIKNAINLYAPHFPPTGMYHSLLSYFRKEPSAVRVLLLDELMDMEVHPKYAFSGICDDRACTVKFSNTRIVAELNLEQHAYRTDRCNCYFLEVVVLNWHSDANRCIHACKKTAWISMNDDLPLYCDLVFELAAKVTDHLVLLRCVRGFNNEADGTFPMQAMKVVAVGSMDKKAATLLKEKRAMKQQLRAMVTKKKKPAPEERVAMKKGKR